MHTALEQYVFLCNYLPKLDIPDVDEILLGRKKDQRVDSILDIMEKLKSTTLKLQRDDATISKVCCFFDTVVEFFLNLFSRLDPTLLIVECSVFETALRKIELEQKLIAEEKSAVKTTEIGSESPSEVEGDSHSLADIAMKKFRESQQPMKSKHVDIRFVCPTSNRCERLFFGSKASLL